MLSRIIQIPIGLVICVNEAKVTFLPNSAALSLPLGRTTVMHMIVRERVPEEQSTGMSCTGTHHGFIRRRAVNFPPLDIIIVAAPISS